MMTTSSAVDGAPARAWQTHGASAWLGYAASPSFAFMAWITTRDAAPMALCASGPGILPLDGMTTMYLLMSLFHLAPWLKLASDRQRARS